MSVIIRDVCLRKNMHGFSTNSILAALHNLNESFGKQYTFELERITEGGIRMTCAPYELGELKTIRFCFRIGSKYLVKQWFSPHIDDNTIEEWRKTPIEFGVLRRESAVRFKAIGCTPWTNHEMRLALKAFRDAGFE